MSALGCSCVRRVDIPFPLLPTFVQNVMPHLLLSELRPQRLEAVADLRVGGPRPEAVHELLQVQPRADAHQGGSRTKRGCHRRRSRGAGGGGLMAQVLVTTTTGIYGCPLKRRGATPIRRSNAALEQCERSAGCWKAETGADARRTGMVEQRWCRPQGQSTHLDSVFWGAGGTAYLTLVVREVVWRPP